MNDQNDFSLIHEFLANFAPSVSGRSAPITPELKQRIAEFARGELSAEQRSAAAAEILQDGRAVELLAEEIRAAA